jgi:hypothetical protein
VSTARTNTGRQTMGLPLAVNTMMNIADPNAPYALRDASERVRRLAMSTAPHIAPLCTYLETLRVERPGHDFPAFDPVDGGVQARVLFLLEAPGPQAVNSTFISRNNPDPTARNMCELQDAAGIKRSDPYYGMSFPGTLERRTVAIYAQPA